MKKSILLLLLICPFLLVNGQIYLGGSFGFSQNGFTMYREHSGGFFINAELKKVSGRYGFGIESEINHYNLGYGVRVGYRIIFKPINLNFDYHFLTDKKLSPYIGVGTGIANTRTERMRIVYGVLSEKSYTGSSICVSLRGGVLIDTKVGKLNVKANYCYIDNQHYYPNRTYSGFDKLRGHILNIGIGMLFDI